MRAIAYIVMTWAALLAGGATAQPQHVAMRLVAESAAPAPGSTVTLAIDATPAPGWHGYWQNPGDAGVETTAAWNLPAGVTAGPLRYPVPQRLLVAGLMNHVYEHPFALLVDLHVPADLARGAALPVRVKLDYLVCTTSICVPESQTLALDLIVGNGAIAPAQRTRFDRWRRALPRPLGSPATWQAEAGRFRLAVPYPADAPLGKAWFYPLSPGATAYAAPQSVAREGDRIVVETQAATAPASGRIEGVLSTGTGEGFAVTATPGTVAAPSASGTWIAALAAFAGAVLGGLILNVMPCVFPILSLKALSLARSGADERSARTEALAYTAGAVLACLVLGAAILALRGAGVAAGWAFQLQDPRTLVFLLLLAVAITANLAGAVEVPSVSIAGRHGAGGAFATGLLAAFVATPCTGPFMGAALGAALVLPPVAALAIFAGLGLGLALPFLLLGFVPALRRRLPRPGAWMERFRRVLAIPMALTAAALLWILARRGFYALGVGLAASAVLVALLWLAGRRQHRGEGIGRVLAGGVVALVAAALLIVPTVRSASAATTGGQPFSEARLAALRAQNRPVFAYFTADWCLTCKVNERAAIDTADTAAALRRGKVAVLVGDWTDGDPALGRFIEAHNRAGVPLYLWYAPGVASPRVLPQLLTPGILAKLASGNVG